MRTLLSPKKASTFLCSTDSFSARFTGLKASFKGWAHRQPALPLPVRQSLSSSFRGEAPQQHLGAVHVRPFTSLRSLQLETVRARATSRAHRSSVLIFFHLSLCSSAQLIMGFFRGNFKVSRDFFSFSNPVKLTWWTFKYEDKPAVTLSSIKKWRI